RGTNFKSAHTDIHMDYNALKNKLGDRYVIINKFHPYIQNGLEIDDKFGGFVFNAPTGIDVSVLLCACDILISDYSSLIFEYSLLARPMIFYAYDLDEYDRERSFYYPYREFVPGEIVSDTNQIINAVENIEKSFDSERVLQFCQKFMSACDGQSTKRIIKWIK
ncbi:MAG: CDP-glycerol glycerophosphotransferase family protein, partial [Oscillospiraceae bacterium]